MSARLARSGFNSPTGTCKHCKFDRIYLAKCSHVAPVIIFYLFSPRQRFHRLALAKLPQILYLLMEAGYHHTVFGINLFSIISNHHHINDKQH